MSSQCQEARVAGAGGHVPACGLHGGGWEEQFRNSQWLRGPQEDMERGAGQEDLKSELTLGNLVTE